MIWACGKCKFSVECPRWQAKYAQGPHTEQQRFHYHTSMKLVANNNKSLPWTRGEAESNTIWHPQKSAHVRNVRVGNCMVSKTITVCMNLGPILHSQQLISYALCYAPTCGSTFLKVRDTIAGTSVARTSGCFIVGLMWQDILEPCGTVKNK